MDNSISIYSGTVGFCDKVLFHFHDRSFSSTEIMHSFDSGKSKTDLDMILSHLASIGFIKEISSPGERMFMFTSDSDTLNRMLEIKHRMKNDLYLIDDFISEIEDRRIGDSEIESKIASERLRSSI